MNADGFTIKDFGLGIPDELKAKIFKGYVDGGADKGNGIGLLLVNRLCDHFGWKLSVETSHGKGTTISINFGQSIRK